MSCGWRRLLLSVSPVPAWCGLLSPGSLVLSVVLISMSLLLAVLPVSVSLLLSRSSSDIVVDLPCLLSSSSLGNARPSSPLFLWPMFVWLGAVVVGVAVRSVGTCPMSILLVCLVGFVDSMSNFSSSLNFFALFPIVPHSLKFLSLFPVVPRSRLRPCCGSRSPCQAWLSSFLRRLPGDPSPPSHIRQVWMPGVSIAMTASANPSVSACLGTCPHLN